MKEVDKYVKQHGEKYRKLITDAIEWLDDWDWNINRETFIRNLVFTANAVNE